ncbi:hypothetical protein QEN19_002128 [Hanseniaspora menglaensis]
MTLGDIPLAANETITVTPLKNKPLGCTVTLPQYCGNDPSKLNEIDHIKLYEAVLTYLVVVIPGMNKFSPQSQYNLTRSFDQSLPQKDTSKISYGHDHKILANEKSILKRDLITIKEQPEVHVLGNGEWNNPIYGNETINLKHPTHFTFHKNTLPKEKCFNVPEGEIPWTRFYRWHIDSALYKLYPPLITTLLGLKVPSKNKKQLVKYGDEESNELLVQQAATCFVSGAKAFDLLSEKDKEIVLNSKVMYAPHPYIYISNCKATNEGLTMVSEKKELALNELPPWEEQHIMKLPLVWTNPVTKKHHLQVHGCCVYKLFLSDGTILELEEARKTIYQWMKPAIAPKNVYAHEWSNGELCIFYNRGVWHSVSGQFDEGETRLCHQCNIASNDVPKTVE